MDSQIFETYLNSRVPDHNVVIPFVNLDNLEMRVRNCGSEIEFYCSNKIDFDESLVRVVDKDGYISYERRCHRMMVPFSPCSSTAVVKKSGTVLGTKTSLSLRGPNVTDILVDQYSQDGEGCDLAVFKVQRQNPVQHVDLKVNWPLAHELPLFELLTKIAIPLGMKYVPTVYELRRILHGFRFIWPKFDLIFPRIGVLSLDPVCLMKSVHVPVFGTQKESHFHYRASRQLFEDVQELEEGAGYWIDGKTKGSENGMWPWMGKVRMRYVLHPRRRTKWFMNVFAICDNSDDILVQMYKDPLCKGFVGKW